MTVYTMTATRRAIAFALTVAIFTSFIIAATGSRASAQQLPSPKDNVLVASLGGHTVRVHVIGLDEVVVTGLPGHHASVSASVQVAGARLALHAAQSGTLTIHGLSSIKPLNRSQVRAMAAAGRMITFNKWQVGLWATAGAAAIAAFLVSTGLVSFEVWPVAFGLIGVFWAAVGAHQCVWLWLNGIGTRYGTYNC